MYNLIEIKVEETKVFKNGNRTGDWYMRWGHQEWRGTWKQLDGDGAIVIMGDLVLETPITQEALEELIYCTSN